MRDFRLVMRAMFPMDIRKLFLIILIAFPVCDAAAQNDPNTLSPMGINLSSVSYWSAELVFVDIFKQSQPWKSQLKDKPYGKGNCLNLTPDGWIKGLCPGQLADSLIFRAGGHYPAGEYICLYKGSGEIEFKFDAKVKSRSKGRILLRVNPTKHGIVLRIKETCQEDPIRNIRVILPGFEESYQGNPFHPDFLKRWSMFKVIRFMDWMHTNNSKIVTWGGRPTSNMQSQGSKKGVALEYMILLANRLHADPWFCMPHMVSYEYVHNFARMVKERLDPDSQVYVEYTNEAWNNQFQQAQYCSKVGQSMSLSENPVEAGLFYYAKRSVEIFKIWEDVFGGTDRLVRVMASQNTNPWVSKQVLSYESAWQHADALAIAPYFGQELGVFEQQEKVAGLTVEQVFKICVKDIKKNYKLIALHEKETSKYGLDLIAYEGGQHLTGLHGAENNELLTFLFKEANRHPQMKELYLNDLKSWKKAGGKLFVTFSSMGLYNKWGSWGLLEYIDQEPETAPKYQGVMEFIKKNPMWWGGD